MKFDIGEDKTDMSADTLDRVDKIELVGMRGRKHQLRELPIDEFVLMPKLMRGMPVYFARDKKEGLLRIWPAPSREMEIDVVVRPSPPPASDPFKLPASLDRRAQAKA